MIENVVTHADYRRLGRGRRVLAHVLDIAWQANCYKVLLATGSKRETTLRFYEGVAFIVGAKLTSKYAVPSAVVKFGVSRLAMRRMERIQDLDLQATEGRCGFDF